MIFYFKKSCIVFTQTSIYKNLHLKKSCKYMGLNNLHTNSQSKNISIIFYFKKVVKILYKQEVTEIYTLKNCVRT